MEFVLNKKSIQEGLSLLKNGLSKKDKSSIYATNVQIIAKEDMVHFITTNGETTYLWKNTAQISKEGSIAVNADKLIECISHGSGEEASFLYEKDILHVNVGSIDSDLKTVEDTEFPKLNSIKKEIILTTDSKKLFKKMLHTMYKDMAKPKMVGLLLDFVTKDQEKTVILRTVSPSRISIFRSPFSSEDNINTQIIFPCFLAETGAKHSITGIGTDSSYLNVEFGQLSIFTPLMENNFINPDRVFKENKDAKSVVFKRTDLIKAFNFVKSFSDAQEKKARIKTHGKDIEISTFSDAGKSRYKIDCASMIEDKLNFAVNSEHMSDFLSVLTEDDIELKIGSRLLTYQKNDYAYVTAIQQ